MLLLEQAYQICNGSSRSEMDCGLIFALAVSCTPVYTFVHAYHGISRSVNTFCLLEMPRTLCTLQSAFYPTCSHRQKQNSCMESDIAGSSLPLRQQAYTRCSGLARPRAPALQCLDVFLGAGELPRRLVFSCVCAGMVPVAPAVIAVLVCACGTGGRRCGLMWVWYLR